MLIISCISYNIIFSYFKNRIAAESLSRKADYQMVNQPFYFSN